jgi:hypothetical protein
VFKTGGAIIGNLAADADNVYSPAPTTSCTRSTATTASFAGSTSAPRRCGRPVRHVRHVYQFVPGTGLVALDKAAGDFIRKPRWVARTRRNCWPRTDATPTSARADNRIVASTQDGEAASRRSAATWPSSGPTWSKEDGIITRARRRAASSPSAGAEAGSVGEVVSLEFGDGR